jgi:hypothetical protein
VFTSGLWFIVAGEKEELRICLRGLKFVTKELQTVVAILDCAGNEHPYGSV